MSPVFGKLPPPSGDKKGLKSYLNLDVEKGVPSFEPPEQGGVRPKLWNRSDPTVSVLAAEDQNIIMVRRKDQ